ncbi:MAG: hypothetical protein KatS3mg026_1448 [Bacteroidia bacterium]|nr:MAG: hypothetical protein KatS3mg026_1448 [Bacteroidia bacterium]
MTTLRTSLVALETLSLLAWAQNVGIGTASPTHRLHVAGSGRLDDMLEIMRPPSGMGDPNASILNMHNPATGNFWHLTVRAGDNDKLQWHRWDGTSWLHVMTLTLDGNVGIGTPNPLTVLSITPTSTGPKITLWDGNSSTDHYGFTISAGELDYHANGRHVFKYGGKASGTGTELLILEAPGNSAPAWSLYRGGGNQRGLCAVDLQSSRLWATQVASGDYAVIGGGIRNTASGFYSMVGGGNTNIASNSGSTVGGGYGNTASGLYSTISGGINNSASGYGSMVCGGGKQLCLGLVQCSPRWNK